MAASLAPQEEAWARCGILCDRSLPQPPPCFPPVFAMGGIGLGVGGVKEAGTGACPDDELAP
eukprot:12829328-Heterocapsa_arctica.AAC.1